MLEGSNLKQAYDKVISWNKGTKENVPFYEALLGHAYPGHFKFVGNGNLIIFDVANVMGTTTTGY
jgi:hypothetical protein